MSAPTPDRAALAEPAPEPPSVAEAREAFVLAVARCRDCGEYGVLCGPQHEALADALIAAVRAATVAEAMRAVEGVAGRVTFAWLAGGGVQAHVSTVPSTQSSEIPRADALDALRALGGQP